jgi:PAS domain S-box-containing protein
MTIFKILQVFHASLCPLGHGCYMKLSDGNRVLVCLEDITERKRAEESLLESQERIKALSDASFEAIFISEKGICIDQNLTAEKMFGYTFQEAVGRGGIEWIIPEDRELVKQNMLTGYTLPYEVTALRKDGTSFPCEIQARTISYRGRSVRVTALNDITVLKRVNKVLQQSEKHYRHLFDMLPYGAEVIDKKGTILNCNPNTVRILGYERDELIGMNVINLFDTASINTFHLSFSNIMNGNIDQTDIKMVRKNGRKIDVIRMGQPIYSIDGKIEKILAVSVDITERKQAEKALQESEEKYKSLTNNLKIGVYRSTIGSEGVFVEVNPAIVKMFGFNNREDFLKTKVKDLYNNPHDREAFVEKILKTGTVKNEELQLQKKSGALFIASVSTVAARDTKGDITHFDGIIEDISERKRVEAVIIAKEEKYRTLLESNPDPVVVYDIEGKVIYFNPSFTHVFGWALEDCLGKKMGAFVPETEWPKTKKMIKKVREGERFSGIETHRYNKNGKIIPVSISGAIYKNKNGNPIGSVINLRDISNQKKMEAQLQQSQKMESIGTLAGGIAHDFNNILFPIIGYSEMLLADTSEDSPFRAGLNQIYTGALRASGLVKQILTFSRQESGQLKLIKIQPTINEALKLIRSIIPTTINIKQNIQADCDAIKADPTQIHQVIMNLATNAYHAMDEIGGEITIKLKKVELEEPDSFDPDIKPGSYACLSISDTGKGMNDKLIEKIFDPFFTTKETSKGTGMGLSVVHGIVKNMKGTIKVYSEPDKGSEFQVYLPLAEAVQEQHVTYAKTLIQGGTEHILFVDDEKAIIEMEQNMLQRLGYKVTSRSSSIEALEVFRAAPHKFDLVITDMAMPNMSGDKLSIELNKILPGIPILLCTGFSETISEEKAASLGISGFLLKPIVMKDLFHKIREVLDKNKI